MIEQAGLASVLSVLIVVGAALLLHEAERHHPPGRPLLTRDTLAAPPTGRGPKVIEPPASAVAPRPDHRSSTTDLPAELMRPLPTESAASPSSKTPSRGLAAPVSMVSALPDPPPLNRIETDTPPPIARLEPDPVTPPQATGSTARRDQGREPHGAATISQPGERLADIAIRVYGSAEAAVRIWQANRDRLASVDAPLKAGWLLRTP